MSKDKPTEIIVGNLHTIEIARDCPDPFSLGDIIGQKIIGITVERDQRNHRENLSLVLDSKISIKFYVSNRAKLGNEREET